MLPRHCWRRRPRSALNTRASATSGVFVFFPPRFCQQHNLSGTAWLMLFDILCSSSHPHNPRRASARTTELQQQIPTLLLPNPLWRHTHAPPFHKQPPLLCAIPLRYPLPPTPDVPYAMIPTSCLLTPRTRTLAQLSSCNIIHEPAVKLGRCHAIEISRVDEIRREPL